MRRRITLSLSIHVFGVQCRDVTEREPTFLKDRRPGRNHINNAIGVAHSLVQYLRYPLRMVVDRPDGREWSV